MKKAMSMAGICILGIFALLGVFLTTIMFHEYTHVVQSKGSVSFNYDLNQASFAHILHDVKEWGSNDEFKAFVEHSEGSADIIESSTGYVSSFFLGGSIFFLLFGRKKQ